MEDRIDILGNGEGIRIDIGSKHLDVLAKGMAATIREHRVSEPLVAWTMLPLVVSEGDRYEVPHVVHLMQRKLGWNGPIRFADTPDKATTDLLTDPPEILVIGRGDRIPFEMQSYVTGERGRLPKLIIVLLQSLEKDDPRTLVRNDPDEIKKYGGFTAKFCQRLLRVFRWMSLKMRGDGDIRGLFIAFIRMWCDRYGFAALPIQPPAVEACLQEVRLHKHRDVEVVATFARDYVKFAKSKSLASATVGSTMPQTNVAASERETVRPTVLS